MKAIYRPGASIAFVASSRGAFLLGEHPQQPGLLVLAQTKTNTVKAPSLSFRITASGHLDAGKVAWEGPVELTADDLLRAPDRNELAACGSAEASLRGCGRSPPPGRSTQRRRSHSARCSACPSEPSSAPHEKRTSSRSAKGSAAAIAASGSTAHMARMSPATALLPPCHKLAPVEKHWTFPTRANL